MRITEGLLPEDKLAIIRWTNSKGADFLQQWAGDALPKSAVTFRSTL